MSGGEMTFTDSDLERLKGQLYTNREFHQINNWTGVDNDVLEGLLSRLRCAERVARQVELSAGRIGEKTILYVYLEDWLKSKGLK